MRAEARWRLVETTRELGVCRALLTVSHDPVTDALFVIDAYRRRTGVTGGRSALSRYRRGRWFYCFVPLSLAADGRADIDYFLPHRPKALGLGPLVDGVWNVGRSWVTRSRGPRDKRDRVPDGQLLERLNIRNEFLIGSNYPLHETLMMQTGATPD